MHVVTLVFVCIIEYNITQINKKEIISKTSNLYSGFTYDLSVSKAMFIFQNYLFDKKLCERSAKSSANSSNTLILYWYAVLHERILLEPFYQGSLGCIPLFVLPNTLYLFHTFLPQIAAAGIYKHFG